MEWPKIRAASKVKPQALDAIRFAIRSRAEMEEEIRRLDIQNQDLQRQINEIGRRVIPDWRG